MSFDYRLIETGGGGGELGPLKIYTLFFNKNKLNKNIEAEIARKIRTI